MAYFQDDFDGEKRSAERSIVPWNHMRQHVCYKAHPVIYLLIFFTGLILGFGYTVRDALFKPVAFWWQMKYTTAQFEVIAENRDGTRQRRLVGDATGNVAFAFSSRRVDGTSEARASERVCSGL